MIVLAEEKKSRQKGVFTEETWQEIISYCKRGLRLTEEELDSFENSLVAKYCAALPYAANCENPDRLAVMLLSLLMVDVREGSPFDTTIEDLDGSLNRIEPYFAPLLETGDPVIIRRGLLVLGSKTYAHWIETAVTDSVVSEGIHKYGIDLKAIQNKMIQEIESMPGNAILDTIIDLEEAAINSWMK
jgi:hypothetical protein